MHTHTTTPANKPSETDRVRAALAERMSGFPLISSAPTHFFSVTLDMPATLIRAHRHAQANRFAKSPAAWGAK